MALEGAGRVHKVLAQTGEIHSDDVSEPVRFNLSVVHRDGESSTCIDLTDLFPQRSLVAFTAERNAQGHWQAQELHLLEKPAEADGAQTVKEDCGIVTHLTPHGGTIEWLRYGSLLFDKHSLVVVDVRDRSRPVHRLLQIGRTVRFKADINGDRQQWRAVSVAPLSALFSGRGKVTQVCDSYGWIDSEQYGSIYFPLGRFVQPEKSDEKIPLPEMLLNVDVEFTVCAALPGVRGQWRAVKVRLASAEPSEELTAETNTP